MRRCVWSRNLKNEEAMARIGPQLHKKKIPLISANDQLFCRILQEWIFRIWNLLQDIIF